MSEVTFADLGLAEPLLRDTRQLPFRLNKAVGRGSTGVKPAYLIRLWQRR